MSAPGRIALLVGTLVAAAVAAAEPARIRDFTSVENARFSECTVKDGWLVSQAVTNRHAFAFSQDGTDYRLDVADDRTVSLSWRAGDDAKQAQGVVLPNTFNCHGFAARVLADGRLVLVYRNAVRDSPLAKALVGWVGPVEALLYPEKAGQTAFHFRLCEAADSETSARRLGRGDAVSLTLEEDGRLVVMAVGDDFASRTMAKRWILGYEELGCSVTFWDRWRPRLQKFLRMLHSLGDGLLVTVEIFVLTLVFALPLGFMIAFGRMSSNAILSNVVRVYISVVRGTPLMLQIIFVYYGPNYLFGISLAGYPLLAATVIAFSLNYAAYFAEIYRAGILSVDLGQREAACALGLGRVRTFVRVILPQVVKRVLPAVTNEVITLVKDTSLAFTIALVEMFTVARQMAAAESTIMPLIAAGCFYYVFNFLVAWTMERLERHYAYYN